MAYKYSNFFKIVDDQAAMNRLRNLEKMIDQKLGSDDVIGTVAKQEKGKRLVTLTFPGKLQQTEIVDLMDIYRAAGWPLVAIQNQVSMADQPPTWEAVFYERRPTIALQSSSSNGN